MKRSAIIVIVLLAFGILVMPLSTNAQRPGTAPPDRISRRYARTPRGGITPRAA